jgi:glycosyltransferase involved in cell wall biosynthesis
MKVVVCHNYFRERGGEDQVFEDEVALLRSGGHDVTEFVKRNTEMTGLQVATVAAQAPWNVGSYRELRSIVRRSGADIVHIHNTLPQLSPALFRAARAEGAAIVHTLHNYRWACPKGILFRDGRACEDCLGRTIPWPAVKHRCYRDSRMGSTVVAATLAVHNVLGTPGSADAYIAAGTFIKDKMTEAGLPGERIYIKPNFLDPDPGPGDGSGDFAMYLGRLSPEKRIDTLLDAWEMLDRPIPLKISGDGPLRHLVEEAAARNDHIEYLGFAPKAEVNRLLGEAQALVFTSGTYEAQPLTIVETFARGTPVIAGRLGAMQGMIDDGETGFLFEPGNARDLANVVNRAFSTPETLASLRPRVRREFESTYTIAKNLDRLVDIYEHAIEHRDADMGRRR